LNRWARPFERDQNPEISRVLSPQMIVSSGSMFCKATIYGHRPRYCLQAGKRPCARLRRTGVESKAKTANIRRAPRSILPFPWRFIH
jgi:hypothetical protein